MKEEKKKGFRHRLFALFLPSGVLFPLILAGKNALCRRRD